MTRARRLAPALLALVALAAPVAAGPPTDQLRGHIDRVVQILADPALKSDARTEERRAAIRSVARDLFDFEEISQRSLGRHWQGRTPAERAEFVGLFADLLERTYISRIEGYTGEKINYAGESLDGDIAVVRTRLLTREGTEIPVDYRLLLREARWRAFDVSIEGISLVGNYRTQFNTIIQRASYKELVAKLRAKREEHAPAPGTRREPVAGGTGAPPTRPGQHP